MYSRNLPILVTGCLFSRDTIIITILNSIKMFYSRQLNSPYFFQFFISFFHLQIPQTILLLTFFFFYVWEKYFTMKTFLFRYLRRIQWYLFGLPFYPQTRGKNFTFVLFSEKLSSSFPPPTFS